MSATVGDRIANDPMLGVPEHLRDGLRSYILQGLPPGGFLSAVLEHDLFQSFARADDESRAGLFGLVSWIYNHAPGGCHGNREKVTEWITEGGLRG